MTTLLEVRDIHASYGHAQALFGVSFDVKAGEVVTLLGRNGMGRSTTIKCLFGLLPVTQGEIIFCDQVASALPSYSIARLGLGLVPEGRQVFPNLTVEENLVATARAASRHGGTSEWTLQRVYEFFPRLQERSGNMGGHLSGGEQQMLAIGRALMTNPRLLVLDEATEGLAPVVRAEIWKVLKQLKEQGLSMIVVDKNTKALLRLSDRNVILDKGVTVWRGSSPELAAQPELIARYVGV